MLKPLGLYIHIPFCVKKCLYCDFNSFSGNTEEMCRYIDFLIKEIDVLKQHTKNRYFDTIFIGGGTPSLLDAPLMEKLCDKIRASFYIDDNVEWTIECNPGTVTLSKFRAYKKMGINRISMGVQSLNDNELKAIGRIHSVKEFMEGYGAARIAGFENINFDLMFSLPGQSVESFRKTLDGILCYEPKHISAYSLQLEEGTPLYNMQNNLTFPSEEENREMYYHAISLFAQKGLKQYEISNFAAEGYESRHNLKYWQVQEYLGIGLGAASFFNNVRYENPQDMKEYTEVINSNKVLYLDKTPMTEEEKMSEFMFMGLRKTKGISDTEFKERFGKSFFDIYGQQITKHINNGLLMQEEEYIRLSKKGLDLANTVMCDFV